MTFGFVDEHRHVWPVRVMCAALGLSASGYYVWRSRPESSRVQANRALPGHWEGDLIPGLGSSKIGTLVERTTRYTMLLHLPRLEGHGKAQRIRSGPALVGHGAEAVRDAITRTIATLPRDLRRSLAWDQGAQMAQHPRLKIDTASKSISAIRRACGSAARTKTPTACCASTFRKART